MARPTLNGHPKFAHLAGLVGGRGPARGYLELIWDAAYACGEPVIGDARKVEAVADWRGARGELVAALVESGFLDVVQTDANGKHLQTFAVHDLEHHAPDYVLKRWQREAERKEKGETVRSIRQRAAAARWKQTDANGEHVHANVPPPAPAPAPAPDFSHPAGARDPGAVEQVLAGETAIPEAIAAAVAEDDTPAPTPFRSWAKPYPLGAKTTAFKAVYERYPRKDAENRAAAAFQEAAAEYPGGEAALSAAILAAFEGGMLKRHPYSGPNDKRPYLETVIAEWRWRDAPSAPDDEPAGVQIARATGPPRDARVGYARASEMQHKGGGTDHEF